MADLLDHLPKSERKILGRIGERIGVTPEAAALAVLRAYLVLAKDCPGALPNDPLSRAAQSAQRRA